MPSTSPAADPGAPTRTVVFRFYAELNDFLAPGQRGRDVARPLREPASARDAVEALGVPHTEVDLILVDGRSVGFGHRLRGGERVAVYPVFELLDVAPLTRLRPRPLRQPRFILDVHLGRLARYLRLLGFDAAYRNDFDDPTLVRLAAEGQRIILTRDRGILRTGAVTHGYWLRQTDPRAQAREVIEALDLAGRLRPFSRCMACNGELRTIDREAAAGRAPQGLLERVPGVSLTECDQCRRVYWPGSHCQRLRSLVAELTASRAPDPGREPGGRACRSTGPTTNC